MGLKKSTCRVTVVPNPCNMVELATKWIDKASIGATPDCLNNLMSDLVLVIALYDLVLE